MSAKANIAMGIRIESSSDFPAFSRTLSSLSHFILGNDAERFPFDIPFSLYQELADVIVTDFKCSKAMEGR